MNELIRIKPVIEQVTSIGRTELVSFDFMLHDIVISNNGGGRIALIVSDDVNTKVLLSMDEGIFSHNFSGWPFWKGAKLYLVKENGLGIVDVSVGVSKILGQHYSVWRS